MWFQPTQKEKGNFYVMWTVKGKIISITLCCNQLSSLGYVFIALLTQALTQVLAQPSQATSEQGLEVL